MSQSDLLERIVALLQRAEIPLMLTGSLASSYYGEPRSTHDIDVVIDPTLPQLDAFLEGLGDEYYVNEATARHALRHRSMFNVIDYASGWKVDLFVRRDHPFSVEEFERRRPSEVLGVSVLIASPEDVILSKLQ